MKCFVLCGLLALVALVTAQEPFPVDCPLYFTKFNNSCYMMSAGAIREPGARFPTRTEGLPYMQANRYCKQQHPDAHLLVVNDIEELQFIFNWVPSLDPLEVWIGFAYNMTTMRYEWINGDPVSFTAWEPYYGEPLIREGGAALMFVSEVFTPQIAQLYGYGLDVSHFWTTEMIDEPFPFICEYNMPLTYTPTPGYNDTNATNPNATYPGVPPMPPVATFSPQILFQQESQPVRLSQYVDLGGIQERQFGQDTGSRGGARPAYPQQYRKRGRYAEAHAQRYGYGLPAAP